MSQIKELLKALSENRVSPADAVDVLVENGLTKVGETVRILYGQGGGRSGKVVAIDGAYAEVEVPNFGKLKVPVSRCKRLV